MHPLAGSSDRAINISKQNAFGTASAAVIVVDGNNNNTQKSEVFPPYEELGSEKNVTAGKDMLSLSKSNAGGGDFEFRNNVLSSSQIKDEDKKLFLTATNQEGSEPRIIDQED